MEASAHLFMGGEVPEPLDAEKRDWLARQISAYPTRVHPERTCAIGALSEMALAEFCRMQSRPTADLGEDGELVDWLQRATADERERQAADRIELYREALEKARDKFLDYAAQHEAKARAANLGGSGRSLNGEAAARWEKAESNRAMADMLSAVLSRSGG